MPDKNAAKPFNTRGSNHACLATLTESIPKSVQKIGQIRTFPQVDCLEVLSAMKDEIQIAHFLPSNETDTPTGAKVPIQSSVYFSVGV
jgi:hypothetical protein